MPSNAQRVASSSTRPWSGVWPTARVQRLLQDKLAQPFDPCAAGLLEPEKIQAPARVPQRRSRLSDLHGSWTLRNIKDAKRQREQEEREAAEAAAERRDQLPAKRSHDKRLAEEELEAFARCEHGCVCSARPCPFASWRRCPQCGPKKSVCKKRECVQLRNEADARALLGQAAQAVTE